MKAIDVMQDSVHSELVSRGLGVGTYHKTKIDLEP